MTLPQNPNIYFFIRFVLLLFFFYIIRLVSLQDCFSLNLAPLHLTDYRDGNEKEMEWTMCTGNIVALNNTKEIKSLGLLSPVRFFSIPNRLRDRSSRFADQQQQLA